MPSRLPAIKTCRTAEQYAQITSNAKRSGLTRSTYAKRLCRGLPTPSLEKRQHRRAPLQMHADLGRPGGLFKGCLSEKETPLASFHHQVRQLLRDIEARQQELKALLSKA